MVAITTDNAPFKNMVPVILTTVGVHAFKMLSLSLFQGTQSANPHNDYCQNFVDTGERPQNFIRDTGTYMSLNRLSHFRRLPQMALKSPTFIQSTTLETKISCKSIGLSITSCNWLFVSWHDYSRNTASFSLPLASNLLLAQFN